LDQACSDEDTATETLIGFRLEDATLSDITLLSTVESLLTATSERPDINLGIAIIKRLLLGVEEISNRLYK
tara:strand:+ start:490 stop:702 length:213 start_codon:yes stop_codon:yes gene_type:complete